MTRDEAMAEAARRGREDPERHRFSWLARRGAAGEWEVARIGTPSRADSPLHTGAQTRPVAPREDPRPPVPPEHLGGF